jgi:hypothetical protein
MTIYFLDSEGFDGWWPSTGLAEVEGAPSTAVFEVSSAFTGIFVTVFPSERPEKYFQVLFLYGD